MTILYPGVDITQTKYIDPTAGTNGSGSFASPYNAFSGSDGWWVSGTRFLVKEGTTWANTVYMGGNTVNGPFVIGTYDAATGEQIKTKDDRRAKIRVSTSAAGINMGTLANGGTGKQNIVLDSLDILSSQRTDLNCNAVYGLTAGTADATPSIPINVQIYRCSLDGFRATYLRGAGIVVQDCQARGYYDGINLITTRAVVNDNYVYQDAPRVSSEDWGSDAIILTIGSTLVPQPEYYEIKRNTVVSPNYTNSAKHGIYIAADGIGQMKVPTIGAIVEDNYIYGCYQNFLIYLPRTELRNNRSIITKATHFNIQASGVLLQGNYADSRVVPASAYPRLPRASWAFASANYGTTRYINNTFRGMALGLHYSASAEQYEYTNNVVTRRAVGGGFDEATNKFLLFADATKATFGGGNFYAWEDGTPVFNMTSDKTWAEFKAGYDTTARNEVPLFDENGYPTDASNLTASGVVSRGGRDGNGTMRWLPPASGAFEYVRARPTRTLP